MGDVDDLACDGVRRVRLRREKHDLLRLQRQPASPIASGEDMAIPIKSATKRGAGRS